MTVASLLITQRKTKTKEESKEKEEEGRRRLRQRRPMHLAKKAFGALGRRMRRNADADEVRAAAEAAARQGFLRLWGEARPETAEQIRVVQ